MHFIIGFACLAGIYHLTRRGHHGSGRHRGSGFKGRMVRHKVDRALRRIEASEDQASEIHDAVDTLRSELSSMKGFAKQSKNTLLDTMTAEVFSEEDIDTAFSEQQGAVRDAQSAIKRALERVHSVLEPSQRNQLVEMLSARRRHHPYR